jgi:mannose-6-phosphate isomerase-like protein (cupin superfamily)
VVTKINLAEKFGRFTDRWSPKIIADLNDSYVKLAKVQGEFVWHQHADEDELFIVIAGELTIELRDGAVTLIEPKATRHTGNVESEMTVHELARI